MTTQPHIPVLRDKVVELLAPKAGETYFDGTAGYGGHAAAIIEIIGESGEAILVDRDSEAVKSLQQKFANRVEIIHENYLEAAQDLKERGTQIDMVLLDLGVSSPQLDTPERGFSFRTDGPLDMRMDAVGNLTAADIVNHYDEQRLANLIYKFGEERKSRRIAGAIVAARPLSSTKALADLIGKTIGYREDIHPATRTFQALRIAVNSELEQLTSALPILVDILNVEGRLAVISFHSLEDRIVKEFINQESRDCICPSEQPICVCDHVASLKKLTRKAVSGTEDAFNPRARSAKLRAAVKIKNQKEPK
ncbi:MAG TPA: 16S rRNA (cytosine(1402)-N(4))-methyltransferase RsmH [Candidatus Saccharimonadales bacterium]|nr:16S rRNA (cytosine(1402)-N(4))-methyltransferase RsmH [Candidatus Saccharimonadales bacterium]